MLFKADSNFILWWQSFQNVIVLNELIREGRTAVESVNTQNIIWTHLLSSANRHATVRNRDDGWLSVLGEGKPETTQIHTHSSIKHIPEAHLLQPVFQLFLGYKLQKNLPSIVHYRVVVIGSLQVVSLDFVKVLLLPYYSE